MNITFQSKNDPERISTIIIIIINYYSFVLLGQLCFDGEFVFLILKLISQL